MNKKISPKSIEIKVDINDISTLTIEIPKPKLKQQVSVTTHLKKRNKKENNKLF